MNDIDKTGGGGDMKEDKQEGFDVGEDFAIPNIGARQGKGAKKKKKINKSNLTLKIPEPGPPKKQLFGGAAGKGLGNAKKSINWLDKSTYKHLGVIELHVPVEKEKGKSCKQLFEGQITYLLVFCQDQSV